MPSCFSRSLRMFAEARTRLRQASSVFRLGAVPHRTRGLATCGLIVAVLATGCGGSNSSRSSPASTRTERTTSANDQPATRAREEAVTAYNAMWADMASAARTADYQSPRLERHAAGDALSQLSRGLYANKQHGIVAKGNPVTNPTVTSVTPSTNPTSVAIIDCFDSTHWLNYVAATGELQNDTPGARHATTATVVLKDGSWKVTDLAVAQDGSC
jgi:hypothetical protein